MRQGQGEGQACSAQISSGKLKGVMTETPP